jgi:Tfp pilus assembly protein PilX
MLVQKFRTLSLKQGFALPSVLVVMSLCGLLYAFAWRQVHLQQRMQRAELSSIQMMQLAKSVTVAAASQFNHANAPLRWQTQESFNVWKQSGADCQRGCTQEFLHAPQWSAQYRLTVWPIQGQALHFAYEVTTTISHRTTGATREMKALWRSDEQRWVFWR